jgi:Bacterial AMP nucleoside phosphorylase N-terminus
VHETTVTRPDLFRAYLKEQIRLLIENHCVPVEIGESREPIPIHFAYRRDINIEAVLPGDGKPSVDRPLRDVFDTPDLAAMDDAIANGTLQRLPGAPEPLALFRAARVDYSLHRLYHYTGTDPEHFQNGTVGHAEAEAVGGDCRRLHVERNSARLSRAHGLGAPRLRRLRRVCSGGPRARPGAPAVGADPGGS